MIYPENFEQKIGFTKIREMLSDLCLGPLGRKFVNKMHFSDRFDLVQKLLFQTDEFKKLLITGAEFPTQHFFDVEEQLKRATIPGTFLEVFAFFQIKMSLQTIRKALTFFEKTEGDLYPNLKALSAGVEIEKSLVAALNKVVDDSGTVKDDASPDLLRIKRDLISFQTSLRKQIQSILKQAINEGWTGSDSQPTIRNGRIVIPILAEYKRKIKGLIHDESTTGQTIFIEPEVVFELNNEIKDLENAYQRELIKILTKLTDLLREHIPSLRKAYQYLGLIDFIRAKALLAVRLEANLPVLHKNQILDLKSARHPILFLNFKKQGRDVVPLSLHLDDRQRILLISGPNAGGKSVALKTVGLLQYMVQSGLLVSAAEGTEMGIFSEIFMDMGDEQSIENDLSTYSSHLKNMKHFLSYSGKKTLILIDEFGTGTEPLLGGAIAESVLDQLNKQRVFGLINTHFTNLKNFAEKTDGIVNGAMRFDTNELQPLFMLETGKPGSSFAIEIAKKTGLPKEILNKASSLVGKDKIKYDRLLEGLETDKAELDKKLREVAKQETKLKKAAQDYSLLKEHLEEKKTEILNEAKQKARLLLKEANQKIEGAIKDIRESQAEKEKTLKARKEIEDLKAKIIPAKAEKTKPSKLTGPLIAGDKVSIIGQDSVGELVSIKGNTAEVLFGGIKTIVKIGNLQKAESEKRIKEKDKQKINATFSGLNLTDKMSGFSTSLDVRGQRTEEALTNVIKYVDDAIMLGIPEIKIIHGRGNGILKHHIRDYLRSVREVASVSDEHIERGGDGVSVVVLK